MTKMGRQYKCLLIAPLIAFAIGGCKKNECVKEHIGKYETKDIRTYPDCEDTTSYSEKCFHKNGKLFYTDTIVNNEKEGQLTYYDSLGKPDQVTTYSKGKVIKYAVYRGGLLSYEALHEDDSTSNCTFYYLNGNVRMQYREVNGIVRDNAIEYDSLNTTKFIGKYYTGFVVDTFLYPNDLGIPPDTVLLPSNTKKHGVWERYNNKGELTETVTYDKGKIVSEK